MSLRTLKYAGVAVGAALGLYLSFVALLTVPSLQDQVIYLHSVSLTWFRDLNAPEQFGFLPNQVTLFTLDTADGERLHAWHVLPPGLYHEHEAQLCAEPAGVVNGSAIARRLAFRLLRNDPDSLLVLYLHGAGGTLGSGWRPASYRAMSAASPRHIHTLAIDYRGFGASTGRPSEAGLLADALALARFAMHAAGIPPDRIVVFGHSLGTAVATALAHRLAHAAPSAISNDKVEGLDDESPVFLAGMVLVAPFTSVEQLTATYRLAGVVPLLGPVAYYFPRAMAFLHACIRDKWPSADRLAEFIRAAKAQHLIDRPRYHVTMIHAQDDYDIPWTHAAAMFRHAANAMSDDMAPGELDEFRSGDVVEWRAPAGVLRAVAPRFGLHDRIMAYPVVSLAVLRAFESADHGG
ncbi:abhydrolase domain-containing protein [Lasiosphaeria miniovina]|uniref:Abhydrolase domain-containing protein n=1 Tax=Lasiosphaeria miniovina TaxID=1954250 RepID=A0AA40AVB3_9PEZI|nr:abhydrolase domain-containing protein [Lasiosphaeria miniovina]KAK0722687.1 abhydrolase domain-containing protein [Lasiosphaeria miniovina]